MTGSDRLAVGIFAVVGVALVVAIAAALRPTPPPQPAPEAASLEIMLPAASLLREWHGSVSQGGVSRSIGGTAPSDIPLAPLGPGDVVSAFVQKDGGDSFPLTVCLRLNGVRVRCGTTDEPYGAVTVAGRR